MKVSVVLTTYNGKKYLKEMLDSLRKQTRKIDEVLIFDDQSSDGTIDFLRKYIDDYKLKGWVLRVNEKNLGWEKNFSQGLHAATGEVIFPCDQDDIWHLDKIEKMTAAFEQNKDILLLVSGYHAFCEDGEMSATPNHVPTADKCKVSKVEFTKKYYQILRPGCTMALHKSLLIPFEMNWKEGTPHDAVLWTIAILQDKLYIYDDVLIEFRRHSGNASKSISHGYRFKVNEVERTMWINNWYISNYQCDSKKERIIRDCNEWCERRYDLLRRRKLWKWFTLFKYKDYYLTSKKYLGDIYYFFQQFKYDKKIHRERD